MKAGRRALASARVAAPANRNSLTRRSCNVLLARSTRPLAGLELAQMMSMLSACRLVKELWLAGAATLAEGNALVPDFIADYNARFAKAPANNKDLHWPLRASDDLEDAFAWNEERTLSQALTLQYDKIVFILEPSAQAKAAIGKPRRRSASG